MEKNIKIVFTDINHLCNQAKKAIDTDGEIQSIFEAKEINCDEKKNVKYLIYQVNSILENEVEFEETVKKLKRIQDLIPEEYLEIELLHQEEEKRLMNVYAHGTAIEKIVEEWL